MKTKQQQPGHDITPGHPDYKPGNTGIKKQEQPAEDVEEKSFDKKEQQTGNEKKEGKRIVNEQEENVVTNDAGADKAGIGKK